jgi:nicotinamidase/pyrazinamidase
MKNTALILVDLQRDFLDPDGSLYVAPGDWCRDNGKATPQLEFIWKLLTQGSYNTIVATKDWHPQNHSSFASNGGEWPDHCIQGTWGAQLISTLNLNSVSMILHKGMRKNVDSYSAFREEDDTSTGLAAWLGARKVEFVDIVGVATEICVRQTAMHALDGLFQTNILKEGCWSIDPTKGENVFHELENLGARII